MGARMSSDTSESPGSTNGYLGASASPGGTPSRGSRPSGATRGSQVDEQMRLEQFLMHQYQLSGTSSSSRRPPPRPSRASTSAAGTGFTTASSYPRRPRSIAGGESSSAFAGPDVDQSPEEGQREQDMAAAINQIRNYIPLMRGEMQCHMCQERVPYEDYEFHFVMCLTKPRVTYNEDVLQEDKGECSICLDDLVQGDTIARLPCLCIYHKLCIDDWFKHKATCPEHPGD